MNIEDVLHYYLGNMFKFTYTNGDIIYAKIENINDNLFLCGTVQWVGEGGEFKKPINEGDNFYEIDGIKEEGKMELILTPLQEMGLFSPITMHNMFKEGIDVFGLIESGQAIDKNTVMHLFETKN